MTSATKIARFTQLARACLRMMALRQPCSRTWLDAGKTSVNRLQE